MGSHRHPYIPKHCEFQKRQILEAIMHTLHTCKMGVEDGNSVKKALSLTSSCPPPFPKLEKPSFFSKNASPFAGIHRQCHYRNARSPCWLSIESPLFFPLLLLLLESPSAAIQEVITSHGHRTRKTICHRLVLGICCPTITKEGSKLNQFLMFYL